MRVHISLEEELVDEIDGKVGPRQRRSYIADAVRKQLDARATVGEDPFRVRDHLGPGPPMGPRSRSMGARVATRRPASRRLMAAVLLDTTVVIDVLKGRPRTLARINALEPAGDTPHVCAVTVEEVTAGAATSRA
jgi:hypothetical protein